MGPWGLGGGAEVAGWNAGGSGTGSTCRFVGRRECSGGSGSDVRDAPEDLLKETVGASELTEDYFTHRDSCRAHIWSPVWVWRRHGCLDPCSVDKNASLREGPQVGDSHNWTSCLCFVPMNQPSCRVFISVHPSVSLF